MRSVPLLFCVALAGCAPRPGPPSDALAALGEKREAWLSAGADADRAFALGRWPEAAAHFERRIALAPIPEPGGVVFQGPLGEETRRDLYNLACARALAGRTEAALDALEMSMEEGPGEVGFDHLAEDPDLAALHGEPRWKALLRALSWNDEVAYFAGKGEVPGTVAVVVAVGEGAAVEEVPGAVQAFPGAPYRSGAATFAWTTRLDPGARAGEKAVFALREAEGRCAVDPARRILRASGPAGVRLAWEILLRHPGVFTRAVLDGPAPPRRALLDRGAERMGTEILAAGPEGVPDPVVGARVRSCGSLAAAWKEALR
jgi:hypothetical protein